MASVSRESAEAMDTLHLVTRLHLVLFNQAVTCSTDAALKDALGGSRSVEMKF